jgi:hypothetical protein
LLTGGPLLLQLLAALRARGPLEQDRDSGLIAVKGDDSGRVLEVAQFVAVRPVQLAVRRVLDDPESAEDEGGARDLWKRRPHHLGDEAFPVPLASSGFAVLLGARDEAKRASEGSIMAARSLIASPLGRA